MKILRAKPRLRYVADLRALGFLLTALILEAGLWSGAIVPPLLAVISCFMSFICCINAHNQMHLPVFRSQIWNSVYQLLLMFGSGQPPTGIITAHNERHHRQPNSKQDFVRTDLVCSQSNVINLIVFPFLSVAAMLREKPDDLAHWKVLRPHLYRQAVLERPVFYSVLLLLALLDWKSTLMFLVLPWLVAQLALVGVNLLQHQDCNTESEYDHSRNVTGTLANWFLLNNGYHTAHHLRPAMHWSLLPEFHRTQIVPQMNPVLDHDSFTGLIIERLRRPNISHAR